MSTPGVSVEGFAAGAGAGLADAGAGAGASAASQGAAWEHARAQSEAPSSTTDGETRRVKAGEVMPA